METIEKSNLQFDYTKKIYNLLNLILVKLYKIDYWFIAAALVETPRLFSSFSVIKEHPVYGIPLSILIAYSTSESWKCYFRDKTRYLILVLNLISLTFTITIISPVLLYTITYHDLSIDLTKIIPDEYWYLRLVYAIIISASTFLPLIILAATHSYNGNIVEPNKELVYFDFSNFENKINALCEAINKRIDDKINIYDTEQVDIISQHVGVFVSDIYNQFNDKLLNLEKTNDTLNEILSDVVNNIDYLSEQINTKLTKKVSDVTVVNEEELYNQLVEIIKSNPGINRSKISKLSNIEYGKLLQGKNGEYGLLGSLIKSGVVERKENKFYATG